MANFKARDQRKEQLWRRWIREWRASGGPVRVFCEARGLAEASFYGWRRELERRDAEACHFFPVRIADEPRQPGAVELVLPGNRTIRVGAGFDAATLRQLLTVLEEKPC
jgi:hypothetical protein